MATTATETKRGLAVVTGANSGVGYEAARKLAAECGFERVLLVCRNPEKAAEAQRKLGEATGQPGTFSTLTCDVSSLQSAREAAKKIQDQGRKVDFLLLNAGMLASSTGEKTQEGLDLMMATSLLGHHVMTLELLKADCLASGARVVLAGSSGATYEAGLNRLDYDKMFTLERYANDATAAMDDIAHNNAPWKELGVDDAPSIYANVKVWCAWWAQAMAQRYKSAMFFCVDPGWVPSSQLGRNAGFGVRAGLCILKYIGSAFGLSHSADVGAQRYLEALDFPESENGSFWVSPEGRWSGTMKASTPSRLPWIHNADLSEKGWAAVVRATEIGAK